MSDHHPDDRAAIARARDYPFPFPREAFVYTEGGLREFDPSLTENRTPVLAIGSNQSPIRLGQKYGHEPHHRIAVQRAVLDDFDVVFSAHIAAYGSVPAMLQVCAGASVSVAITWLDDEQLEIMNRTEIGAGNYHLAELSDLNLRLDDGRVIERLCAYIGRRGHFQGPDGQALALRAVPCENRRFADAHTHEALELVRERHATEHDPDGFILNLVRDRAYRRRIIETLSAQATPFDYPVRVLV